jgi:hypothetical protein
LEQVEKRGGKRNKEIERNRERENRERQREREKRPTHDSTVQLTTTTTMTEEMRQIFFLIYLFYVIHGYHRNSVVNII